MPPIDLPANTTKSELAQAERIGLVLMPLLRDITGPRPDMQKVRDLCTKVRMLQKVRDVLPDSAGAQARYALEREMLDALESFVAAQPE